MDRLPCHVVYVNRLAGEDRLVQPLSPDHCPESPSDWKVDRARELIQPLLDAFGDVHVCASGEACMSKLIQLQDDSRTDTTPTLVLLDTPHDEFNLAVRPQSSATSKPLNLLSPPGYMDIRAPDEELYGLSLLQKLVTEAHLRNVSKLVVPVPVISLPQPVATAVRKHMTDGVVEDPGMLDAFRPLIRTCLDIGAVDVLISPISPKCIATLEICAYKARRDAAREQQALMEITKGRKRSWVGINEQRPFAYLREEMVSGLMKGICRLDNDDEKKIAGAHIAVSQERQAALAASVGHWHFSAHEFSDDELLLGAVYMFKHVLALPELEHWRLTTGQLISFLVACRAAYNSFVPYHNFRHVVDVLQATFSFLIHIAALPPFPHGEHRGSDAPQNSQIAELVTPFESLTLLITAIGHDVGHPGVNNGFLTTLNAPLAQLYNDRSVLESFHCAAYSQILRRYWSAAFEDRKMRNLMISSILATDMGLHFDYMKKLGDLQEKLGDGETVDGWNGRQMEEYRALVCALLIKCADISNVARGHETALQWMYILSEEFSRQAHMEDELDIKSSLMAPPKKDVKSLANAQLGFMNMFAIPLFQGVADIMPGMQYTVDELDTNKGLFETKVQEEKAKESRDPRSALRREGTKSPRTRSVGPSGKPTDEKSTPMGSRLSHSEGAEQTVQEEAPQVLADVERRDSVPVQASSGLPLHTEYANEYKEINGQVNGLGHPVDSHDFEGRSRQGSASDSKTSTPSGHQRCSETTEGSASAGYGADWQSQATSATGKPALSPSTQGTSIVSNESMERTLSASGPNSSPPSTSNYGSSTAGYVADSGERQTEASPASSVIRTDGKTLKKRPSRFRMKDFPFFRRNRGTSPNVPAADASN
ncbi:hypothetical protein HIM_01768 [Hirsutella minnesotensis 3608]|nr:hypothetical protein HIM_01768 [Hirsutella minnesotensis 3608]